MTTAQPRNRQRELGDDVVELQRVQKGTQRIFDMLQEEELDQYISKQFGRQTARVVSVESRSEPEYAFSGKQRGVPQIYPQANIVPRKMQNQADSLNRPRVRKCTQDYVEIDADAAEQSEKRSRTKPARFHQIQVFRNEGLALQGVRPDIEYMDTKQEAMRAERVQTVDMAFKPRQYYQDKVEEATMQIDEAVLTKLQKHNHRPLKIQAQKEEQICPEIKLARRHGEKLIATPHDTDIVHVIGGRRFANPLDIHEEPDIPTARLLLNGRTIDEGLPVYKEPAISEALSGKRTYNQRGKGGLELEEFGYSMFSGMDVANQPLRITQIMQ